MNKMVTALIGAVLGLAAIWMGFNFHMGPWIIDGPWATLGAAVGGAIVALIMRYAIGKE
jgi:hypothetical protein